MGTFLTNPKMSPELRARIEASVRGRTTKKVPARRRPGRVLFLRLGIAIAALCVVSVVVAGVAESRAELVRGRRTLVERVAKADGQLTNADRELPIKVAAALMEASHEYPGARVSETIREVGLESVLRRPSLYLRTDLVELGRGRTVSDLAEDSNLDALSTCLRSPPAGSEERELLPKVRDVERDAGQFRLHDALAGLQALNRDWRRRAEDASSRAELRALDASLDPKLLDRALKAVKAELLVYVIDEPKAPGTITEIDGANDHVIRMGIVELSTGDVLLRHRARVEPSWVTEQKRSQYAKGLCDCRFAHELHQGIRGK